jgi:hypothetical protein
MPLTYTNRKGTTYTLCQARTQKGNVRYFFSPNPEAKTAVDHLPPGYEISQRPPAQAGGR